MDKQQFLRAYMLRGSEDPSKPMTWVASSEGMLQDGFDLKMDQWDLTRYNGPRYGGPVLYAHDYIGGHLPLGTGKAYVEGGKLLIDVSWDVADPFSKEVARKSALGMLGGSVGWQRVKKGVREVNELLEFSICPVSMDPSSVPLAQLRAFANMMQQAEASDVTSWDRELHDNLAELKRLVDKLSARSQRGR